MSSDWEKIYFDPDWIRSKRYDNSLATLLAENPDGASDRLIGQALGIPEEDVEKLYEEIVEKLRTYVEEE